MLDKPIVSYRRYSEEVNRGEIPKLPGCPRMKPVAGLSDWLTLPRAEGFMICPACYQAVFADSGFRHAFVPAPFRPTDLAVTCDFGSSFWYRIAWLMTLKHQLTDMRLLERIAGVAARNRSAPCVGSRPATRTWYSITDQYTNQPVGNFTVCLTCTETLEALFANLVGIFRPVDPLDEPRRSVCAMHFTPERKRFLKLFDQFEMTSDKTIRRVSAPDIQFLAEEVRRLSLMDECMRDAQVREREWHVLQSLPRFTVCEECFVEVVWPMLENEESGGIARNFFQRAQKLPTASCQLYSDRMRDIFWAACRENDIGYLEDAVMERQRREADIKGRLAKLKERDLSPDWKAAETQRLIREWKDWE
jgi:hypothetical protein